MPSALRPGAPRFGRRVASRAALASVTALGVLGLSACGAGKAGGDVSDGVDVVASFYPMRFLAEEVGGEHVSVTSLVKPGVEPHDLELGPQQTASLGDADLVVYLKGFQPTVDEAVELSGPAHVAEASSYTELREHGGHEREEEHGHGEGSIDPHVWLDPVKYAEMAQGVGKALAEADPDHASDYRKNAEELAGKLKALDTEFREGLANRRTDTFVTTHAAFGYLAERYGLHEESIAGLDPESGPSGARMKELHEIVEHDGVDTVFFEPGAGDGTAHTLAEDLGLRTDVLDPVEGITDASRGDDYLGVMRANLQSLRKALGAK